MIKLLGGCCSVILVIAVLFCTGVWMFLAQPSFSSNDASEITVDTAQLKQHVIVLSETFFPRNFAYRDNLNNVLEYMQRNLVAAGGEVTIQEFTASAQTIGDIVIPEQQYKNLSCLFGKGKGNRVVVGAHYDSFGQTPGADDNASGIAGLLELAFLLQKHPPDREIELVAYCLEEPPFFGTTEMGSYAHAKHLKDNNIETAGVIVLEMIGYFTDEPDTQKFPVSFLSTMYPTTGNFITVVGSIDQRKFTSRVKKLMKGTTPLPIYSMTGPSSLRGIDFSDHRNYWAMDIDAVMITDTSFYRNQEYHKAGDTADRLDYQRMGQVVVMVYEATRNI